MGMSKGPRLAQNSFSVWEIRWREGDHSRRKSLHTRDAGEARMRFGRWLLGQTDATTGMQLRVADAWLLYVEEHLVPRRKNVERAQYAWARLRPSLGQLRIAELQSAHLQEYERARAADGAAASTIRRELGVLYAVLNHLVRTRRIPSTAVPYYALPAHAPPRERWLTLDEIDTLLSTAEARRSGDIGLHEPLDAPSRVELFTHIALRTGARLASIEKLAWDQVDLERGVICFNPPGKAQSAKRRPTVPIATDLRPVLERAFACRKTPWVLGSSGSIRWAFNRLVHAAGMPEVTPHTLRHTWASHAAMSGVPLTDIARVLGNSVDVVVRVYAHFAPEYLRSAINQAFGGPP